jgi:SAM-dependent methyltransferase
LAYGKFAFVYDRLMAEMPYDDWISFAEGCFARFGRPATIADLGCGTGSVAIPLSAMGCKVFGIDLSDEMLAIAQEKSSARKGPVSRGGTQGEVIWLQQDMREWELVEKVDAAVSFCDSVNYLTEPEDVAELFERTFAGLKPGGWFAFDVHPPQTLREYAANQPFVYNEEDLSYIWECALDDDSCTIEHELTFFVREQDGESYSRFDEIHTQRAYPLEQLQVMLNHAGFKEVAVYADFTWEEADEETSRAFFVARKPKAWP